MFQWLSYIVLGSWRGTKSSPHHLVKPLRVPCYFSSKGGQGLSGPLRAPELRHTFSHTNIYEYMQLKKNKNLKLCFWGEGVELYIFPSQKNT